MISNLNFCLTTLNHILLNMDIDQFFLEKNIRIALVTYGLLSGGQENSILRLARFFTQKNIKVDIITTEENGSWFTLAIELGYNVIHVSGASNTHPIIHSLKVGRQLTKGNYNVIFLNNARYAQAAIRMLPNKMTVIPILRVDTDLNYKCAIADHKRTNAIIGISHKLCEIMRKQLPDKVIKCISNGVDIPSEALFASRILHSKNIKLLYVGRLSHEKGVLFLPDIIKGCKDLGLSIFLDIVGDGIEKKRLEQQFNQYSLDGLFCFHGLVSPDKINQFLLNAHIIIVPSLYEGLGNIILEAQGCGCVPVASKLLGVTDTILEDGEAGFLCDIGDIDHFVTSIKLLCEKAKVWTEMSTAGRKRALKEFSVEVMGFKYLKLIYESLKGYYPIKKNRQCLIPINPGLFTWRELVPFWVKNIKRRLFN